MSVLNMEMTVTEKKNKTDYVLLKQSMIALKEKGTKLGLSEAEIVNLIQSRIESHDNRTDICSTKSFLSINFALVFLILITISAVVLNGKEFSLDRCIIDNNYFLMEMTRPITDCKICENVYNFTVLQNVSKEEFSRYAYLGHPLLVRGGCLDWSALDVFSFEFFKNLYSTTPGAFETVEDECQFFPFRTTFLSLYEVLNMPRERANMTSNAETWYIGW